MSTPKTVTVRLMMPRAAAEAWLRKHAIPFSHVQEQTARGPTDVRIRRGYLLDFEHAMRRNPRGLTAKEERQYKAIAKSGRRRYGKRAKEVAARTVLARRGNPDVVHCATVRELSPAEARKYHTLANPPLPVKRVRAQAGHLVSTHVRELVYQNVGSVQRTPYTHRFRQGVDLYALKDGSLLICGARGQRLWDKFIVRDSE